MAATARAAELIDEVRSARNRPLIGVDLRSTDVADLCLRQSHLLFGAGRVLLLGKMLLAKSLVAVWAAPKRLLAALVTAPRRHAGAHRSHFCAIAGNVAHLSVSS